ncbi:MAG: hypothetical protein ACI9MX_001644 [Candidatus Aldehydirespiratoraceae bacterium]|jgi:hypothetical protein
MARTPLLRLLSILFVFALIASSCSDDATPTAVDPPADEVSDPAENPDVAAETEPDDAPVSDDDTPVVDDDMGDDPTPQAGPYCTLSAEAVAERDDFDALTATPESVERYYRAQADLLEQAAIVVPDVIADDLAVLVDLIDQTIAILEPTGWDVVGSVDALTPLYESSEASTAGAALDDFDESICGRVLDEALPDESVPPPGLIDVPAEAQAYCARSFALAEQGAVPAGDSAEEAEQFYSSLVAQLDSMIEVAPAEILTDVMFLQSSFQMVYDILAAAEWDLAAGLGDVEAWAADPQVADAMDDSIDRLSSYDSDVCGIDF